MNNKKIKKIIGIVFLVLMLFSSNPVKAKINESYATSTNTFSADTTQVNSLTLINWIVQIAYTIANGIETLCSMFVGALIGDEFFPWSDLIIFNTIPVLDVNFINPEKGSMFMDIYGDTTVVGDIIRNLYFTGLSIALAILGFAVAIVAIRLAIASIGSEKGKYKNALISCIFALVLLFGMHYIISLTFYINEKLVETASRIVINIISEDEAKKITDDFKKYEDENNQKIVENFTDKCNVTSPSPITLAKKVVKEAVNLGAKIGGLLGNAWDKLKSTFGWTDGDDMEENVTLTGEEIRNVYDEVFPSKEDVIRLLHQNCGEHGIDVAAYLLKDYHYRDLYLFSVAGNDSNKFNQSGVGGWLTSFSNTVMWASGIIDTGLMGLENLYESTHYICVELKAQDYIKDTEQYLTIIDYYNNILSTSTDEKILNTANIYKLYTEAYYRYIYDGDDKIEPQVSDIIYGLGDYFKEKSWYIDIEAGKWSPETLSVVHAILYCILVFQSFIFFFTYIKRFFFVIILSISGPIIIIFDFIKRSF